MGPDLLNFIIRNLFARKLRTTLTVLGICVGIAAVVALVMLSSGLQAGIANEFASIGSDKLFVRAASAGFGPPGTAVSAPLTVREKEIIEDLKGVKVATGRLLRVLAIEFDDEIVTEMLASMPDDSKENDLVVEFGDYALKEGRWGDKGKFEVVLGISAVEIFEDDLELGDILIIEGSEVEVVGIIESTGNPEFDDAILMSEKAQRELIGVSDEYDGIVIQTDNTDGMALLQERIEDELRDYREVKEGSEDFTVQSPEALLATLTTVLVIVQGVLVGIAGISLFVGSVGIMNTMYTSVVERTREIGILRAIGARGHEIRILFLVESGILGFFGGLVGIAIGVSITLGIEFVLVNYMNVQLLDVQVSYVMLFVLLLLSTVIGAASGYFPSKEASTITPLEAIRG